MKGQTSFGVEDVPRMLRRDSPFQADDWEVAMAIYSETRPDEDILNELGDVRSVLILGCSMCANTVYSLKKDLPLRRTSVRGLMAIGTNHEIGRISSILSRQGVRVESIPSISPFALCCGLEKISCQYLARKSRDVDKVVALCCEAGQGNIAKNVCGKQVVGTLNAKGLIRVKTYRDGGRVLVDNQSVSITRVQLTGPRRLEP